MSDGALPTGSHIAPCYRVLPDDRIELVETSIFTDCPRMEVTAKSTDGNVTMQEENS